MGMHEIDINGVEKEYTLKEFLMFLQENYGVEVNMLSYAVSILHSFFSPPAKRAERMQMTMPELVESVTKTKIDEDAKYLMFGVLCVDKDDEDVELPPIRYRIRN